MTWASTHKGNYIYEIADHGALIVASKLRNPTKYIEFTWDYGKTWERVEIADRNMEIHNIISEPRATSQNFIVYGTEAAITTTTPGAGSSDEDDIVDYKAAIVYVDFSKLHTT